ncbi:putative histone-lysine N-methyltransferase CG1716 isoform X1 [Balamuthia mandrillaris]
MNYLRRAKKWCDESEFWELSKTHLKVKDNLKGNLPTVFHSTVIMNHGVTLAKRTCGGGSGAGVMCFDSEEEGGGEGGSCGGNICCHNYHPLDNNNTHPLKKSFEDDEHSNHCNDSLLGQTLLVTETGYRNDGLEEKLRRGELTKDFGQGKYYCLHKHLRARPSSFGGKGVFATKGPIQEGEVVWFYDNESVQPHQKRIQVSGTQARAEWGEERWVHWRHFAWQVADDQFVGYENPDEQVKNDASNFMNHSCDPNVWYVTFRDPHKGGQENQCMVARRDIAVGEELTYDYCVEDTEDMPDFTQCLCGVPCCRGVVTGLDYQRQDLQERYRDHWSIYIRDVIKQWNEQQEQLQLQQQQQQQQE